MSDMSHEKSLPPIPTVPKRAGVHNIPQRSLRTPEDKLKLLQKENQQLCRKLDSIQSQCEAKDRHVRHLEAEIARYREQCNKQNKAVEHIADTIALAFRDYQDITGTQPSSEVAQQPNTVDEISITYADVISAWSDSSLE